MGKYRDITDLASFVRRLSYEADPLHLVPAADLKRRSSPAARLAGGLPELPDPVHEDVGSALLPLPARGRHVLPWSVVLDSVRLAVAGGTTGQLLDGFEGQYLALILEGAEGCDYDDEFKAAIESGDAVWDGKYLHVRVGGRPVETLN